MKRLFPFLVVLALIIGMPRIGQTTSLAATTIYGQTTSTASAINGGAGMTVPSASTLNSPAGICYDSVGLRIWVADSGNCRVVGLNTDSNGIPLDGTIDVVLGRSVSDTTDATINLCPAGTASARNFSAPQGIYCDTTNNLLIVPDVAFNRVSIFTNMSTLTSGTAASAVIGQADMVTGGASQDCRTGSGILYPVARFNGCTNVAMIGNNLLVADTGNNRVLEFAGPNFTTGQGAVSVIGQDSFPAGDPTCATGTAANRFSNGVAGGQLGPFGIAVITTSGTTRVFVADGGNNRVNVYTPDNATSPYFNNGKAASFVIGQPDFNTVAAALGQNGIHAPTKMSSNNGNLIVADTNNNRVMIFSGVVTANQPTAVAMLGQSTYTATATNCGSTTSAGCINTPQGTAASGNHIAVVDNGNHRVALYTPITATTAAVSATKQACRAAAGVDLLATTISSNIETTMTCTTTTGAAGVSGTLSGTSSCSAPTFTCSSTATSGTRDFTFNASDSAGFSIPAATATLTVTNQAPTVTSATVSDSTTDSDTTFYARESSSLSCAGADSDSDSLSCAWTQLTGTTTTLSGTSACATTFTSGPRGTYSFRCTINDGDTTSNTATSDPSFTIANSAATVTVGTVSTTDYMCCESVTLPGSVVTVADPDGATETFTYLWEFVTVPTTACSCPAALVAQGLILPGPKAQTAPTISSSTSLTGASFTPTGSGDYTVKLTVTDSGGGTTTSNVTVPVQAFEMGGTGTGGAADDATTTGGAADDATTTGGAADDATTTGAAADDASGGDDDDTDDDDRQFSGVAADGTVDCSEDPAKVSGQGGCSFTRPKCRN